MTKALSSFLLFFGALFMASCSDDDPKDSVREITVFVSSETDEDMGGFGATYPSKCMLVKFGNPKGEWQKLGMYRIDGFIYEKGHEYELRVKRTILAYPPADGYDRTYSLVRIVKDNIISP